MCLCLILIIIDKLNAFPYKSDVQKGITISFLEMFDASIELHTCHDVGIVNEEFKLLSPLHGVSMINMLLASCL